LISWIGCIAKYECSDAVLMFTFDRLYCLVTGLKGNNRSVWIYILSRCCAISKYSFTLLLLFTY